MKSQGAWIFLSHSSKDIEVVRKIRNAFEDNGHNPLAFHLKCMQTDTAAGREELDELIKREIDARQWFVFCESPNAAESPYVQMEREYILQSKKSKVWSLDITGEIEDILQSVKQISRDLMVYVDSLQRGRTCFEMVKRKICEYEYTIVEPCESDFDKRGYILYLIQKDDLGEGYLQELIEEMKFHIFSFGYRFIPVFIENFEYEVLIDEISIDEYNPIVISQSGDGFDKIIERINNSNWIEPAEYFWKSLSKSSEEEIVYRLKKGNLFGEIIC